MKYCIECKYYTRTECKALIASIDHVTGTPYYYEPIIIRQIGRCGPDAKLFQPANELTIYMRKLIS